MRAGQLSLLSGNEAVALAVRQSNVDVVSAFPITPQTAIVEKLGEYITKGEMDAEFVSIESEHSALSACVGASLTGARAFTATSSQGLALMHEILYVASGLRCPIVMAVANRALSAPINIHCDHSDMMGSRDCGWVQIFVESVQEAYDRILQAYRLAEDPEVLLPVAVNMDGFSISHCYEGVDVLDYDSVGKFLPRRTGRTLDFDRPATFGAFASQDSYYEIRAGQCRSLESTIRKLAEVEENYPMGRRHGRFSSYNLDGSDTVVVCMGSVAGTVSHVIAQRRELGKVGVMGVKLYRPFPHEEFVKAIDGASRLVIMDRAVSPGAPAGPLAADISTILHQQDIRLPTVSITYGLGGREPEDSELASLLVKLAERAREGREWQTRLNLGLREMGN